MSITNKEISTTYKDWLIIDNSNAGFDTNIDQVKSGNGNGSSLYLSTNNLKVQPTADSTTNSVIYDKDGNILFQVDSTNDAVKALGNHVNSQYAKFSTTNRGATSYSANTHYAVDYIGNYSNTTDYVTLGTSTNPDTSLTVATTAHLLIPKMWYVPDAITIDAVSFWVGGDAASGDTVRCHLMAYDIVTTAGATGGDLSNGVVVADGADISNDGYEQAYYQAMTIQSASVSAGKALFFTFRQDGTNSDYSISSTIKYHLT